MHSSPLSIKLSRHQIDSISRWSLGILSFLGFVDATYLTVNHYLALAVPCSLTHGCDTVLTSVYATIGFMPVALIGMLYYLLIFGVVLYIFTSDAVPMRLLQVLAGITGIAFLSSCYLLYLQIFVIHAICEYCLGSAIISTLLFPLNIVSWKASAEREKFRA